MKNKNVILLIIIVAASMLMLSNTKAQSSSGSEAEIRKMTTELLDAVGSGNKKVWDQYLDENCVVSVADGRTFTKSQMLDEIQPRPKGYVGSMELEDVRFRDFDNTAVICYLVKQTESIFSQSIITRYRTTDSYLKRDGAWKLIASEATVLLGQPRPATVSAKVLDTYVGEYGLAPGMTYTVSREESKLWGQSNKREKTELIPQSEAVFYRKGIRGEKVFVRDQKGVVAHMLDRRDGNDIVWKKIK